MICLRHAHCRWALLEKIIAWPTATNPRYFVVVYLGVFWYALGLPLLFIGWTALLIWGMEHG